jgi:hypothetical protein
VIREESGEVELWRKMSCMKKLKTSKSDMIKRGVKNKEDVQDLFLREV